jgi:hypothetical protein
MKKLTIIAALAMAAAAFAIPSSASALWTHNHSDIQAGNNPQLHFEGSYAFQSSGGQINCTSVTSTIQLTGGQTTGHVNSFTANNPQTACHTNGGIIGHCTVTSMTPVGLPWLAHADSGQTGIRVTGLHTSTDLHGFLCPDLTFELVAASGDVFELTGTETKLGAQNTSEQTTTHTLIHSFHIEGKGTATPLEGPMAVAGTITATPGQVNTYGWT